MIKKNEIAEKLNAAFKVFGAVLLLFVLNSLILKANPSLDTTDIKGPIIEIASHCGDYLIEISDDQSYQYNIDTFHLDGGIVEAPVLLNALSNNISEIFSSTFESDKTNYDFSFRLEVLNKFEAAKAVFFIVDKSNNASFDSIIYKPEKLAIEPENLSFGSVYVGSQSELSTQIKNISISSIKITNIGLKYGKQYRLKSNISDYLLGIDEFVNIAVLYAPDADYLKTNAFDYDTLIVETTCLRYVIPISGIGVIAKIIVDDIDFGAVEVNTKVDFNSNNNPNYGNGLRIVNPGSGNLVINGYYDLPLNSPFSVSIPTIPDVMNLQINPETEKFIKNVSFEPISAGEYEAELIFKNNALGPDSICKIRGIAYNPGPYLNSLNFGRVRLGDIKKGFVYLKNSSDKPILVSGFIFNENNPEFRILFNETVPQVSQQNPVRLYPDLPEYKDQVTQIAVAIEFFPIYEYNREIKIMPMVVGNNDQQTVFNYIRGFGFKPAIRTQNYVFLGQTLVNVLHPDIGTVRIFSESWSSDLYIKKIDVLPVGFSNSQEFILSNNLPSDTLIKINEPYEISVRFNPSEAGEREILLRVISDAYVGRENSKWDTSYISIKGKSYNKVLAVENLNIDNVFHCNTKQIRIKIKNISDSTIANISNIVVSKGDSSSFTVENKEVTLQSGDSIYLNVSFDSNLSDKDTFEVYIKVISDVDTSTGIIRVFTYKNEAKIKLPIIENALPGVLLDSGPLKKGTPEFDITGDFTELVYTDIYSFSMDLKYNKSYLYYANKIMKGSITELWTDITATETDLGDGYAILSIKGIGNNSLRGLSGVLCKPVFMILLGDTNLINVELVEASFGDADRCVSQKLSNGLLRMSYCGDEVRKVVISNRFYDLKTKSGNPIFGDVAEITYTVAIDAFTSIEMINNLGETVQTISNSYLQKGEYNHYVNVKDLSAGMYLIKIQSGPYIETLKIMIVK